jgi:uncharacterized protein YegJ (DUF2314 family)
MKPTLILPLLLVASAVQAREDVAATDYDVEKMDAAIKRARDEVDKFIKVMTTEKPDSVSVKVLVKDGDKGEHFWLNEVTFADGKFTGKINNDPNAVKTVKFGQSVTVPKAEITDWLYMKGRKMYGNYTLRVLIERMPAEEKKEMAKLFELAE